MTSVRVSEQRNEEQPVNLTSGVKPQVVRERLG
jgi:hypothetical protein